MVFKTIESDITKSGQALSLFGKEIKNIYRDFNSAIDGMKLKEINNEKVRTGDMSQFSFSRIFGNKLSKQDIQSIRDYNEEIRKYNELTEDCVSPQTAFYKCLGNSSSAAQELARNANGAAVSEEALKQATDKVTISAKLASGAMRLLANVGLALAINLIITGITKAVNRFKEIKESTDNLISSFKSLKEETDDLAKNSSTLVSEYSKLAKGVNSLGENVSLTADEYKRYKEIANQIAKDIPSLIIGYDNEGNAILKLKDNVDELKKAYIEARKASYQTFLSSSDVKDTLKNFDNLNSGTYKSFSLLGAGNFQVSTKKAIDTYKEALTMSYEEIIKIFENPDASNPETYYLLSDLGLNSKMTQKEFEQYRITIRNEFNKLETEYSKGLESIQDIANAYLYSSDKYDSLDSSLQAFASLITNNIPDDIAKNFSKSEDIGIYVENMLKNIDRVAPDVKNAYNSLLAIDVSEKSISDSKKEVDKYISNIASLLRVDANQLKIQLGFEFVDENEEELNHIIEKALNKYNTGKKEMERSLLRESINSSLSAGINERGINTKEELAVLAECIDKTNSVTKAFELYDIQIQQTKSNNNEMIKSTEDFSKVLDTASKEQSALKSAMEDMADTGYISSDTYATLVEMGGDFTKCLEVQNGKLVLNIEKLKELKKAEYDLEIQTRNLAIAETEHNIALYAQGGHVEDVKRLTEELTRLRQEKAALITLRDEFDNTKPDDKKGSSSSSKSEKPQSVLDFEQELKDYQHEINMGRKEEDAEYYDWLDNRAHEVYDGLTDYQDELYKYEGQVVK